MTVLYSSLDAIAAALGVYRGDAAKWVKCCNLYHLDQCRIPHSNCDGKTVKGWETEGLIEHCKKAVRDFSPEQESVLRERSRPAWRAVKLGLA